MDESAWMPGPQTGGDEARPLRVVPHTIPDQVIERLVAMIATGRLRPGQRLIETELARTFETSRMPVRDALRTLEAQGVLETTAHRGTHVKLFDAVHIAQLAQVRYALELIALRAVMPRAARRPGLLDPLDAPIERMAACCAAGDRHGLDRADIQFHRLLCEIAGNDIVTKVWQGLAHHLLVTFGLMTSRYPDSPGIVQDHRDLKSFLARGPERELEARLARHIGGLEPALPPLGGF